jgi:hypothetical protein
MLHPASVLKNWVRVKKHVRMDVKSLSKTRPRSFLQKVCCEEQLSKTDEKIIQFVSYFLLKTSVQKSISLWNICIESGSVLNTAVESITHVLFIIKTQQACCRFAVTGTRQMLRHDSQLSVRTVVPG